MAIVSVSTGGCTGLSALGNDHHHFGGCVEDAERRMADAKRMVAEAIGVFNALGCGVRRLMVRSK